MYKTKAQFGIQVIASYLKNSDKELIDFHYEKLKSQSGKLWNYVGD